MDVATIKNSPVALTAPSNAVARPAATQAPAASAPASTDGVTLSATPAPAAPAASTTNANSAPAGAAAPQPKDWTIITYFCSDNNLHDFEANNLKDMEQVGGTKDMNLVAEFSNAPDGGGVVRYDVQKGGAKQVQDLGKDLNMSTPDSLADCIKWAKANYPAKHYAVIMNDHGNGWEGCCQSESKDGWLTLPDVEEGVKKGMDGQQLDVLGFDCCLMSNSENLDQIGQAAKFVVGSEETEGGPGWAYNQVMSSDTLRNLQKTERSGELTPEAFAKRIVTSAHGHDNDLPTMSAFDTSKTPALMDAIKSFGQAIINDKAVPNATIAQAADSAQSFYLESDLSDFASKVADASGDKDKALTAAAQGVQAAISNSLVAEEHSSKYPGAHGLTVELTRQDGRGPQKSINPDLATAHVDFGKYSDLRFAQDIGFNKAVDKFRS